eukprot:s23_g35.t1
MTVSEVVIRYAKGKPECTIELQVLSRCVLVPDAAEHIPKVWGAAEQGRDLVLERAAFGCLKTVVQDAKSHYSPAHGLRAATQISLGMKGLQIARVVHADLSCRNILVSQLGEDRDKTHLAVEGTEHEIRKQPMATRWCAPQHCAFQKLSHKGDVWSTGTLIWEMFSRGNIPWVNWTKRTEVAAKLKDLAEAAPGSPEFVLLLVVLLVVLLLLLLLLVVLLLLLVVLLLLLVVLLLLLLVVVLLLLLANLRVGGRAAPRGGSAGGYNVVSGGAKPASAKAKSTGTRNAFGALG